MKALRPGFGLLIAISVVTLAGIMLGRAVAGSRIELATARAYHDEHQLLRAVEHYRRALRWSFPLSPFHDSAVSGLTSIAAELEAAEDRDGALLAWRSLGGGIAATRFIYSGRDADAVRAKDQIDRLLALQGGAAMDANIGTDELPATYRRPLAGEASPDPLWGSVLLFGFALWIGSLLLLISRGFSAGGELLWPAARVPLTSTLAGLVSFIAGLVLA